MTDGMQECIFPATCGVCSFLEHNATVVVADMSTCNLYPPPCMVVSLRLNPCQVAVTVTKSC
jgi:hypothetical protein